MAFVLTMTIVSLYLWDKLADVIVNQGGDQFFNRAILEQYNLSRQLWIQLMESKAKPIIQEVFSLLASVEYDKIANIDSTVVAMHNAFDKEIIGGYDEAFSIVEAEKNENI